MTYSDCPQADELTRCLVAAYTKMSDREIETGGLMDDLHNAIKDHKGTCPRCRKTANGAVAPYGRPQRVA